MLRPGVWLSHAGALPAAAPGMRVRMPGAGPVSAGPPGPERTGGPGPAPDPLRPGHVLVAPPGRHTLITRDETIALIYSGPVPPCRPSPDLLLTTLALAAGPRVVAIVLSGEGQAGLVLDRRRQPRSPTPLANNRGAGRP